MPQIPVDLHNKLKGTLQALETDRSSSYQLWRELADYFLPRRYNWLLTAQEQKIRTAKNPFILDGTGTLAARTLAAGMMNGITSPARPWFRLRINGFDEEEDGIRLWLDEVTRRMLLVMAESNFYNAMAVMYLDLVIFGTAAMLIYEDYESVIRCYNPCLGEFYLAQSDRLQVNTFARTFTYKVHQVESRWGIENLSPTLQAACKEKGARLQDPVEIVHLIQPNRYEEKLSRFPYREFYWEKAAPVGTILSVQGYNELPGVFPRWELSGNDTYGSSPAMDAFGDVIQLQLETKRKAQALDKMVSPPVVADVQLMHRPTALMAGGVTYVAGANSVGVKPAYSINFPIDALTIDIREVQGRIRETFHNDLFQMISQLDTVRSATEIDARREEKLVLLGSVLERFENECLDPGIERIFQVMGRSGLIPPPPTGAPIDAVEIQYVSILSSAQRAVAVIPTERWLGLIGQTASVYPKALNIPNWDNILRDYGRDIGVPARGINSPDQVAALNMAQDQLVQQREAAASGAVLVDSAKTLSETEVGGGANALQRIIGG